MQSQLLQPKRVIRSHGLDVLRGVAVLLVLFRHLLEAKPVGGDTWLYAAADVIQHGGWVGVDLFFVLSGFLIFGILYRQFRTYGRIKPGEFLIRRAFKIYPAFWVFIAISVLTVRPSGRPVPIDHTLAELFFVQNYFTGIWGHTWSLAVEEHSYIFLCLLLTMLWAAQKSSGNPFRCFPILVIVIASCVLLVRVASQTPTDPENLGLYFTPTHLRCDSFLFGALVSYGYHFSQPELLTQCSRMKYLSILLGIACLTPVFVFDIFTERIVSTWLFTSNAIGCCLILMGVLGIENRPFALTRPLARIGESSYSIYLWHTLVGNIVLLAIFRRYQFSMHVAVWVPAYLLTTISAGTLMALLVEKPFLRLREKWFAEAKPAQKLSALNVLEA